MSFEETKAYLSKQNGNASVLDHLSETILQLIIEKPEDPLSILESTSVAVKKNHFALQVDVNQSGVEVNTKSFIIIIFIIFLFNFILFCK